MPPLTPFWQQPSHPEIQEVHHSPEGFLSKSLSKISLPPFGLFAKMSFPPCTPADKPTYATVQCGRDAHLNLNSDLVYINHSCEPSLIFDISSYSIIAGPKGLQVGEELTFFYPSTEWSMDQAFDCFCGTRSCRGRIAGASQMTAKQLEGLWLNGYIREMIEERDGVPGATQGVFERKGQTNGNGKVYGHTNGHVNGGSDVEKASVGGQRSGPGSRALSGEMGGDTN